MKLIGSAAYTVPKYPRAACCHWKMLTAGGNSLHSGMLSCMSPCFCPACWLSPEGNETMLAMFLTGGRNASPAGNIALVRGEGKKINEFTKAGFLAA